MGQKKSDPYIARLTTDYVVTAGAQVTILQIIVRKAGKYRLKAKMNMHYGAGASDGIAVLNFLINTKQLFKASYWRCQATTGTGTIQGNINHIEEPEIYLSKGDTVNFQVGGATQQPTILGSTIDSKIWIERV
jgi:hypothetical protein